LASYSSSSSTQPRLFFSTLRQERVAFAQSGIIGLNNAGSKSNGAPISDTFRHTTSSLFSTLSNTAGDASSGPLGEKRKARLVFLGTPDIAAASLLSLLRVSKQEDSCFEVVGVVTQPAKRRKRKGKPEPTPVAKMAMAFGMPETSILTPTKASDPEFLDTLQHEIQPDICVTAAYGQYLPKRFLAMPSLGTVNIHPSLLPRWRGASPVQRSLEAGDNPIGVSLLYTVAKMDAGPIVCQKEYDCDTKEQATDVLAYLFGLGTACLIEALPDIIVSGKMTYDTATPQNEDDVVQASMIAVKEGNLKPWKESATQAHNKVRAFSNWPGTWLYLKIGDDISEEPVRLKAIETRVRSKSNLLATDVTDDDDDEEGTHTNKTIKLGSQKGSGLLVKCHDGSVLELLQVQPNTKKVMDAKSFVNGLRGQTIAWVEMPEEPEATTES
jgi:methionyl-tRNA formyltransferase